MDPRDCRKPFTSPPVGSILGALAVLLGGLSSVAQDRRGERPIAPASASSSPRRIDTRFLPNTVHIREQVFSGGQPEGEQGFAELQTLGVKTVISVDGKRPDVELARKYGLRYVHLPHGYDGISPERARELAKAVRELPGPVYIHCHHGKHRSPAAAAVAGVTAGQMTPEEAARVLDVAGTSAHYRGLFQSVAAARPLDPAVLARLPVNFTATADLPALAEAMVAIEGTFERLTRCAESDWRSPVAYPDLDPAHEALLLREHFTELRRSTPEQPVEYRQLLEGSAQASRTLEAALRRWQQAGLPGKVPDEAVTSWKRLGETCTACHRQFRDRPRGGPSDLPR